MLPRATFPGQPITFLDALFTSASATCVTGLTVVDTATCFTTTGQIIILTLIQIGGLGIMTISSFLVMFFGKGIGVRERVVLREMLNLDKIGLITNTLRNVVLLTFGIEAAGTLLLMVFWQDQGWSFGYLAYTALFHSVAAFCNAGFSTFTDSLCGFSGSVGVLGTISMLIIFGGLGFIVIMDIGDYLVASAKNRKQPFHLKIQTRLVILISVILIVAGMALVYLIERISGNDISFLSALFISITARTAGFNSIDMSTLACGSAFIVIFLMFIGASPGSTGGGIKTTTAGVLVKSIFAIITGQNRIIMYHKRIPFLVLNRALVVFTFSVIVVAFMVFILSLTEKTDMVNIIFEVVSAFGTVGLSRNLTPDLSVMGKIAIIGTMFIGRIGALTLAFAITQSDQTPSRIEYPSESIMVG
jgi:trk system potassium uptake protein TrkH